MRFLITAGGTREYIDPVRFISNASSGKMGYELCKAALSAGHQVTLITACENLPVPKAADIVPVETSKQMFDAVKKHFEGCDCLIMAAAVSDYAPKKVSKNKIKKAIENLTLELKPTVDILKWAGQHKKKQSVVGFALEDRAIKANAGKKLKEKKLDMIIANSPSAIGADDSEVLIKTADAEWLKLSHSSKELIARKIISICQKLTP